MGLRRSVSDERGASLVSYSLLLVLILVLAVPAATPIGNKVGKIICEDMAGEFEGAGTESHIWQDNKCKPNVPACVFPC